MASNDEQRVFRQPSLNQAPIDVWSTREKWALAKSVQKSGDQNWNSVSRPLKSFAEPNRPADWFNSKFCAIQYRDMLEKIEVPKRKRERKERGAEETAQDLIVKKLTNERINELTVLIQGKIQTFCEKKARYDKLKKGDYDEKFFAETCAYIRSEQKRKREEAIAHEKWLVEREAKILAMNRRAPNARHSRAVSTPTTTTTTTETPTILAEDESKPKVPDEKSNVIQPEASAASTAAPIESSSAEKGASTLDALTSAPTNLKSPNRPSIDLPDNKVSEKPESPLSESNKDDDLGKEEYETASDGTVKMDTDETKSTTAAEVTVDESSEQEERPSASAVKTEVIAEQENSNDTIEEAFESIGDVVSKDAAQTATPAVDRKGETPKTEASTSGDITTTLQATSEAPKVTDEVLPESPKKRTTEHPEIKVEEDSSISVVETKSSTADNNNNEHNLDTSTPTSRRKRRKSQKVSNATAMQTRSTRSQSQIKVEEPKEQTIKAESTPKASYGKRQRSNSADETSVENTISEESNDAKSSANDSAPSEVEIDLKWRKVALGLMRTILANRHAPLFLQSISAEGGGQFARRQMDLNAIKKRITEGQIRSFVELKRDLMLMFTNVFVCQSTQSTIYKAATEMEGEILRFLETNEHKLMRSRERTPQTAEVKTSNRRKTRGSISLENSISKSSKKKN